MSENRSFFRDTMQRIIADTLAQSDIEAAEERVLPANTYDALTQNGITLMMVPEAHGGIGASTGDAAAILRAAGYAALPGPLLETIVGQWLLAAAGVDLADGLISLAFVDTQADFPVAAGVWNAPPTLHDVPWGVVADNVLLIANVEGNAAIALTGSEDWEVEHGQDAAGEPRDRLTARNLPVRSAGIVRGHDHDACLRTAAILRAAQILGGMEWAFHRTVEYVGERKQFGREISKFQVIQQMLAEMADHALAAAGIVESAAETVSPTLVAAARARLADASDAAITICHQAHGAIGYSKEYALNLRTRRLMAWRDDYGSVPSWRRKLAGAFAGLSRDAFWPAVADAGLASMERTAGA